MRKRWQSLALAAGILMLSGVVAVAQTAKPAPAAAAKAKGVDWTGLYLGAHGGYAWGSITYHYGPASAVGFDITGFAGGLTVGYNRQKGALVVGVEGDYSATTLKGSIKTPPTNAPCYVEGCSASLPWFGTGRARLGVAMGNLMPYATGGVAFGDVKGSADFGACNGGDVPPCS